MFAASFINFSTILTLRFLLSWLVRGARRSPGGGLPEGCQCRAGGQNYLDQIKVRSGREKVRVFSSARVILE